jgi:hypothetical protein
LRIIDLSLIKKKKTIIAIDEKGSEKEDIKELTKLVEQFEYTWELAKED